MAAGSGINATARRAVYCRCRYRISQGIRGVSENLQRNFAEWVIDFESNYRDANYDWERWNNRGTNLARKLKQEIGDQYLVEYHYPHEDPRYDVTPPIIEII
jgi:hypothetical protein